MCICDKEVCALVYKARYFIELAVCLLPIPSKSSMQQIFMAQYKTIREIKLFPVGRKILQNHIIFALKTAVSGFYLP